MDMQAPRIGPPPIRPETLTDQVTKQIRTAVRDGSLVPGELYSVYQIAESLSVSRSPARSALFKLEEAGAVQFERNRGFRIVLPSPRQIAEIFAVRLQLEVPATARAARLRSDATIADLERILKAARAAADDNDVETYFGLDSQLHEAILRAAGNLHTCSIVSALRDETWLLGTSTDLGRRTLTEIEAEHEPIVAAIIAGDADTASSLMYDHIATTGVLLVRQQLGSLDPESEADRLCSELFIDQPRKPD